MQITINDDKPIKTKYPWVGKTEYSDSTTVVLFTAPGVGVCLYTSKDNLAGCAYDTKWLEDEFKPCSITLSSIGT